MLSRDESYFNKLYSLNNKHCKVPGAAKVFNAKLLVVVVVVVVAVVAVVVAVVVVVVGLAVVALVVVVVAHLVDLLALKDVLTD